MKGRQPPNFDPHQNRVAAVDGLAERQRFGGKKINPLDILNETGVLVPGEEGLRDIRVVEAIQGSVGESRRVVI